MSKLDRLVGIKVFGWSIVADSDGEPIWSNDCGTPLSFQYASAPVKFGPNFSTEIAAAWEVLEHMQKTDAYCDSGNGMMFPAHGLFIGEMEYTPIERMTAKDAALAICRAALRAVGVPESEIQEAMR